jgi:DNA polymerase V
MNRVYALVDCDAFFCNCERLFREELRHRPVIVLSNNDGCAVSRTKEAKALGIEMGAPYFKIQRLCEQNKVAVFSSNFSLYTNISSRVMNSLKKLVPKLQVYSVDEAFLDLSGIADPFEYGKKIKQTVEMEVGVPISVGIASTKGLCKAACFWAKKNTSEGGVVSLLDKAKENLVLGQMPVEKIWGIGRKRGLKLRMARIATAKDFRDFKNDKLIQSLLTKVGREIQDELRGQVIYPIENGAEKKKEIMSSRTFGKGVYDKEVLAQSIATHASEVAEELRQQGSVCREVSIYIRTNPFKEQSAQYGKSCQARFDTPTNNTFKIIKAALKCLDEIYVWGFEYKQSGVSVGRLQDDNEYEIGLFQPCDTQEERAIMSVMDRVNFREGPRTMHSMACGVDNREWKMNREFKSPRYTTSWEELPECV